MMRDGLIARVEDAVRGRGGDPAKRESTFRCPDPTHHANGDATPTARWNSAKKAWHCPVGNVGGGYVDLAKRLGLDGATQPRGDRQQRHIDATYNYTDEGGTVLYQVVRYEPKDFAQRRPDGKGGYTYNLIGVRRVLYRLPQLLAADPAVPVYVVEGEKDADALAALGLVATTNPGGAGKWRPDYTEALRGRRVVIIPDNDAPGRQHADQVERQLRGVAASVQVLALPNLPAKGDVSDWLAQGGTRAELERLVGAGAVDGHGPHVSGFVTAAELVAEPEEPVRWLVDGLLPSGGLSIAVAKPKVGKSTLARTIAVGVARNQPVLGRAVAQGPVLYLALEEKKADIRRHLAALGVPAGTPLYVHVGPVPDEDWLTWLRQAARTHQAVLVIIDPLARLLRVKKMEDYAELTKATEPLIALAHETGAHVHCVHHAKKAESAGTDSVLGSTQLAGFVDTVLAMRRHPCGTRTLESIQRTGTDLPERVVLLDPHSAQVALGGSLDERRVNVAADKVVAVVAPTVRTEEAIQDALGGDRAINARAIRQLHGAGRLVREGDGKKGDPFRYYHPNEERDGREREERERIKGAREKREKGRNGPQGDSLFSPLHPYPLSGGPDDDWEEGTL